MTLFRRPSAVSCYYCLSLVDPSSASSSRAGALNPPSFRCPYCACWNRYDARGQIISDEPAMHDERLNIESFAKRGSPDRNQLPSLAGQRTSSPFCRACQTNQTLLINLRAAYLPDPSDPSYATRIAQLPAYVASLQSRYPPVCTSCQPSVDAEIAKKDEYARTRALGGALKVSARPPSRARAGNSSPKNVRATLQTWRIRGVLWSASLISALSANIAGFLDLRIPPRLQAIVPVLPFLMLISLAWTFWDPTYSLQQRTGGQGRRVRVGGRQKYIIFQSLAWLSRLCTSILLSVVWLRLDWDFLQLSATNASKRRMYFGATLALELSVIILSCFAITIHKPAPIRLIDTSAHRALSQLSSDSASRSNANANANGQPSVSYVQPEPDLFATLSLSGNPVLTSVGVNPMFGQPSLAGGHTPSYFNSNSNANMITDEEDEEDENTSLLRTRQRDPDAMDWEPSFPAKQTQTQPRNKAKDDGTWLRQQRFFPPEEPTGLENLLMRTRLVDEDDNISRAQHHHQNQNGGAHSPLNAGRGAVRWGWVYVVSVLPVVGVGVVAAHWLRA